MQIYGLMELNRGHKTLVRSLAQLASPAAPYRDNMVLTATYRDPMVLTATYSNPDHMV